MKSLVLVGLVCQVLDNIEPTFYRLYEEFENDICIYGRDGLLDSIDLVRFVVEVEYEIEQVFNKKISIVSNKTFSLVNSPFRSIDVFIDYLEELINK